MAFTLETNGEFTRDPFNCSHATSRIAHEEDGVANLQQLDQLRHLQKKISIWVIGEAKP